VKTSEAYTPGQEPSVFDYYGEAEQEVNTKSYDKNLWAKALVEAEGDELKRKARYIEIRANQLYIQNLGSISKSNLNEQPLPDTDVLDTIILGTYYSKITGIHGLKANKSRITIKQIGNKIVGTNDSKKDNDINGTREGDTIKFKYWTQWREYTGKWKISPDGTRLEGSFEDINGYGGKWILTKIE